MLKGKRLVVLGALLAAVSCSSGEPTDADGQAIFERNRQGEAKVLSFKKTKGAMRETEVDGKKRKVYLMDYEAEVECLRDTYLDKGPCKKGEKQKVTGFLNLKNDGDGWKEPGP